MRVAIILGSLLLCTNVLAKDVGEQWFDAFKRGNGNKAAKVTIASGLRYGHMGTNSVITTKVSRHYGKVFRKIRRMFKKAQIQKVACSLAGRELGYMSREWEEKNQTLSEWIRRIPEDFCGAGMRPPDVWLIKVLEGDLPHAIILFDTVDEEKINGFYHF